MTSSSRSCAAVVVFPQIAHRQDPGVELVDLVVPLPHFRQRGRADDQRPGVVRPLEVLDDGRADVGLAQAHHVGHERAAVIPDHLDGLLHGHLLEVGQLAW